MGMSDVAREWSICKYCEFLRKRRKNDYDAPRIYPLRRSDLPLFGCLKSTSSRYEWYIKEEWNGSLVPDDCPYYVDICVHQWNK